MKKLSWHYNYFCCSKFLNVVVMFIHCRVSNRWGPTTKRTQRSVVRVLLLSQWYIHLRVYIVPFCELNKNLVVDAVKNWY